MKQALLTEIFQSFVTVMAYLLGILLVATLFVLCDEFVSGDKVTSFLLSSGFLLFKFGTPLALGALFIHWLFKE